MIDGSGNLGPICTSMNSGATWTQTSAPSRNWLSVASSADGAKLVAAAQVPFGGLIYISTNSGATWTQTSAPTNEWLAVASSTDGTKLVAVAWHDIGDGLIYTSSDSGATWMKTTAATNYWVSVASSADGTKLLVAAAAWWTTLGNGLYVSSDSGTTWTPADSPGQFWSSVASSADATKLVAAAEGPIYTLQFPLAPPPPLPSPRLSINPSGGTPGLSWLVPSTRYALQQNPDLSTTNWTDVPTSPTLNYTNLHHEVTVSPSLEGRFFRLKQQ
jgi:uncharacterized protein (DUF736 family)